MIELEGYRAKISELRPALCDLYAALDIDACRKEAAEAEDKLGAEGFWENPEESQGVLKRIKKLKNKITEYESLADMLDDAATLCDMAEEEREAGLFAEIEDSVKKIERGLPQALLAALMSGEYDGLSAIVSFHAGAGGTEAQDWAEMLYRMYTRWAERRGFKYKVLDYLDGDEAGLKSASILIEGENVYGFLKSEAGVHRLVRISPFDSSGRRHTSFAAVEVMPDIGEEIEVEIRDEDLRVDTYRASGAGGQHVNKTESAVRLTHLPTGIVAACQNERSQHQNKDVAMRMLKSKLIEIKERENYEKIEDIKGEQKLIEWGSQIRSYVFMPYTLAKDHRTGFEVGNIGAVMDGEIDGFINAYLRMKASGE